MTREAALRQRISLGLPDLTAVLYLYPADAGGRKSPIGLGWGCPCIKNKSFVEGWDGYPLLDREIAG